MVKQAGILQPSDLQQIRLIVREEVRAEVKDEVNKQLVEKLGKFPTKTQFYKKMDKWMKATTTKDLERSAHKSEHDRTSKRLDQIESKLGIVSSY